MKISEYLDEAKLAGHVNRGLVTVRHHDTLPLSIYCYSKKAVYSNHWDDITTKTRGLIVDKHGDIIARPYEKFFSVEQSLDTDTAIAISEGRFGPPVITEKVNGCLGIFWKYGVHWGIATKGSFHSPHAAFATKWMEDHIEHNGKLVFPEGYTPVFEIICQEVQPHVIKYSHDHLVLLSLINIQTGEEKSLLELMEYGSKSNLLWTTIYPHLTLKQALSEDNDKFEGYVATYNRPGQTPLKLKIKFPTFIKNRRLFYAAQKQAEPENMEAYVAIFTDATNLLRDALVSCTTRKEFADYFNKVNPKLTPVCFAMMDERDHKRVIWRMVERETLAG